MGYINRTLASLAAGILLCSSSPVEGFEISWKCGEITGAFDTTVTSGVGFRVARRKSSNVGIANGGTYRTLNEDDGNLNYDQWDVYSAAIKSVHELDLNYENFSFFGRVTGLYDFDVELGNTRRTPLSKAARGSLGADITILDYYVNYNHEFDNGNQFSIRVGQQVLNWGESTFIQNGLNVINPVDVAKLRTAGAELRDALLPVPMVRVDLQLTQDLSIGGFYQWHWRETRLDPKGTYFSTNDFISPGGHYAMLTAEAVANDQVSCTALACAGGGQLGYSVRRGDDNDGAHNENYGISATYFAECLNNTEFNFFGARYASRLPVISGYKGAASVLDSYYFVEYPDDLWVVGISFNTMIKTWALQGEYSYHFNQPLQIDEAQLLAAALGAGSPQLGVFPANSYVQGYIRRDYSQAQMTTTKSFGPKWKADDIVFIGEVGATFVHNMPGKATLNLDCPGTPPPRTGIGELTLGNKRFADDWAMGYRFAVRGTFNNAIGSVNLIPTFAFSHDLFGRLPTPISHFVADRMSATVKLRATYQAFAAEAAYTGFWGGRIHNLLRDRDFITISASYSF